MVMFQEFYELATEAADDIEQKRHDLDNEEQEIRQHLDDIAKMRAEMPDSKKRFSAYITACASNRYLCPVCFITDGRSVETRPKPSNNKNDVLECPHCQLHVDIEV